MTNPSGPDTLAASVRMISDMPPLKVYEPEPGLCSGGSALRAFALAFFFFIVKRLVSTGV